VKSRRANTTLVDSSNTMLLVPRVTRFNTSAMSVSAQISRCAGEERAETRDAAESCIVNREASGLGVTDG